MGLRFVLGRAGTGKTTYCLDAIAGELRRSAEGTPLVLLLPAQSTFSMEQALLRSLARPEHNDAAPETVGYARAHVAGFSRLAWRVFQELGGPLLPELGEMGRLMVLRAMLLKHHDQLRLFGAVADKPGFISQLGETLSELRRHCVNIPGMHQVLPPAKQQSAAGRSLRAKLEDLSLVLGDYNSHIQGRFTDPDDTLPMLAPLIGESQLIRGGRVWIDGFTGFTPQELVVLQEVLRHAEDVVVTLALDSQSEAFRNGDRAVEEDDLFHPTLSTHRRLTALAQEAGVAVREPLILEAGNRPRFRQPVLAHLEEQWDRHPAHPFTPVPEATNAGVAPLTVLSAANRREEIEAAARHILRLVRDEGLRFRDIALVVPDLEPYHDILTLLFEDYRIPIFMDRRRPVPHHPLVETLRSALEASISDWRYEQVFRFLKTDLCRSSRREVDLLENYVLEFGIWGDIWHDGTRWEFRRHLNIDEDREATPSELRNLEEINRIRDEATTELAAFHRQVMNAVRRPAPVRTITAALFSLLQSLQVPERIQDWVAEAEQAGDLTSAQEHLQVWNGVVELMDQMVSSLPDVKMLLPDYLQVLEAGLEGLTVGLIPPGLDQLVVSTVERFRPVQVRAMLVLGASEQAFPRPIQQDVIFSDSERDDLSRLGIEIGPTSKLRVMHEQFLAYTVLTRAGENLWVSYPASDDAGRAVECSPLVRRLRQLVPCDREEPGQAVGDVHTPQQLVSMLVKQLRQYRDGNPGKSPAEVEPELVQLYNAAVGEEALRHRALPVLRSLGYQNLARQLPGAVVERLFENPLSVSATTLQSIASCPFMHFAAHGLRLKERFESTLDSRTLGQFHHAALSRFVTANRPGQDTQELLTNIVDELAPRLENEMVLSRSRSRHLRRQLHQVLHRTVRSMEEPELETGFRNIYTEASFGPDPGARLPALQIGLADGQKLLVSGYIDRLDRAVIGPNKVLRVIDYKMSAQEFSLPHLCEGLSMQLAIYMLAARAAAGPVSSDRGAVWPGALLYMPVHDRLSNLSIRAAVQDLEPESCTMLEASGWVLNHPDVVAANSSLIHIKHNKDNRPGANAPVATLQQFEDLLRFVEVKAGELGGIRTRGVVSVTPYRLGKEMACTFCSLRPVCHFDESSGDSYRELPKLKKPEAWQKLSPR